MEQGERAAGDDRVLAAICLSSLLSVLVALSLAPFLPAIARETGTTVALVGQVPAAANLAAAALGLLGGPIADRYGYRRSLLVGVLALVLGAAGIALAWSLALLVVAALFTAVSRALVQPVGLTIAATRFTGAARRRAISLSVAAVAGSGILGVPLLTAVDAALGWRAAFGALALLGLGAAGLCLWALPVDPPPSPGRLRVGEVLLAYRPLLADRPTMGLVGSNLVRTTGLWQIGIYIAAYLIEVHGLSTAAAGLSFTAFGGGLFLGSVVAGRLGALPLRTTSLVCSATAGGVFGAAMAFPVPPLAVMALTFVGALVNGIGNVATTTLLTAETRAGRATTMTVNQSAFSLGGAAGAAVGGALITLGGYQAIGLCSPLFGVAAAGLIWYSRPRSTAPAPAGSPLG